MHNDLIDNLDNSSKTKPPAISRQIIIPKSDIPGLKNNANGFKEDGNFLDDRLQG